MVELVAMAVLVYTSADKIQAAPADITADVTALTLDSLLDPAGHSSMRNSDGFSIPGCKCSSRVVRSQETPHYLGLLHR